MTKGRVKTLVQHKQGQSMVEFAMILPLMVLIVIGVFDLGRAFFAFIAISNAAREAVRVYTFTPDTTTIPQITSTVRTEVGSDTLVDPDKISNIVISCPGNANVTTDAQLASCPSLNPVRVTVSYTHDLILGMLFSKTITIVRYAEMMKP